MAAGMERQISLQVANMPDGSYDVHKPQPYPFFIGDAHGTVGRQDFWKGEPKTLLGFQATRREQRIDLSASKFWDEPALAIGMYPVFMDAGGMIWNHQNPVTEATVYGVTDEGEAVG